MQDKSCARGADGRATDQHLRGTGNGQIHVQKVADDSTQSVPQVFHQVIDCTQGRQIAIIEAFVSMGGFGKDKAAMGRRVRGLFSPRGDCRVGHEGLQRVCAGTLAGQVAVIRAGVWRPVVIARHLYMAAIDDSHEIVWLC